MRTKFPLLPVLAGAVLLALPLQAQQVLPVTKLYAFQVSLETNGTLKVNKTRLLSEFNPKGYNNQPCFIGPQELYVTVQTPEDQTQTDIYSLNLANATWHKVTTTPESEFSPTPMPGLVQGQKQFTCVRVEQDGRNSQRLWQFPFERNGEASPAFPDTYNVGYYQWMDPDKAVLFIVGTPHTLVLAEKSTQIIKTIAKDIGRCLQKMPGGELLFLQKSADGLHELRTWDPATGDIRIVCRAIAGQEDFQVLNDGSILMGQGSTLYRFIPQSSTDWLAVANFSRQGVQQISRMAWNGKDLLVVVDQQP